MSASIEMAGVAAMAAVYSLFMCGAALAAFPQLKKAAMAFRARRRLRAGGRDGGAGRVEGCLDGLLRAACGGRISPRAFTAACLLIFASTLLAGARSLAPLPACTFAVVFGAMPLLIVKIRAESVRRRVSHEGESLVAAFLNQYRIEGFNVYETLEKLVSGGTGFHACKDCLFRLLLELRGAGSGERMRLATDAFARAIDANWSRMLAYNIWLSAEQGMNVSSGVEDILVQLREARALMEERKRLNAESVRIVIFLVPSLYIGSAFMSTRFLGMPLAQFMKNQLGTPEGFMLLALIVFLFFVNMMLVELATNQKLDF
ncbi:MAG: hypothetical protein LBS32_03820 [Clostridiales Family XIII bacterium]|jgi:hypothetical protein|nr:hypothetical protein [Clostridiales Family XIII bacterium]